jgi:hypothetical protein
MDIRKYRRMLVARRLLVEAIEVQMAAASDWQDRKVDEVAFIDHGLRYQEAGIVIIGRTRP